MDSEGLGLYLERVVTECIDAEFNAYCRLPAVDISQLALFFLEDGPAYAEVYNLLHRHQKKRWVLSNDFNPSTKRLLDIKCDKIDKDEAFLKTREYWYLRWWDDIRMCYGYPYRETNHQIYVLRREEKVWKVYQNLRPAPRTSTPLRWNRR